MSAATAGRPEMVIGPDRARERHSVRAAAAPGENVTAQYLTMTPQLGRPAQLNAPIYDMHIFVRYDMRCRCPARDSIREHGTRAVTGYRCRQSG